MEDGRARRRSKELRIEKKVRAFMKLRAFIDDYQTDIQIVDQGTRLHADLDHRRYELKVRELDGAGYLFISYGQVFDCRVEGCPESGKPVEVIVGVTRYRIALTDPKRLRGSNALDTHTVEAAQIVAQMPGKVVRVLVKVGEQIAAGSGIMVVEAMKMQNEMKSPKAGVVAALNVQVGATVNGGDVLAVVE
jgi:biotin carboxyl carrier protein